MLYEYELVHGKTKVFINHDFVSVVLRTQVEVHEPKEQPARGNYDLEPYQGHAVTSISTYAQAAQPYHDAPNDAPEAPNWDVVEAAPAAPGGIVYAARGQNVQLQRGQNARTRERKFTTAYEVYVAKNRYYLTEDSGIKLLSKIAEEAA